MTAGWWDRQITPEAGVHWQGAADPPADADPRVDTWSHGVAVGGRWVRTEPEEEVEAND